MLDITTDEQLAEIMASLDGNDADVLNDVAAALEARSETAEPVPARLFASAAAQLRSVADADEEPIPGLRAAWRLLKGAVTVDLPMPRGAQNAHVAEVIADGSIEGVEAEVVDPSPPEDEVTTEPHSELPLEATVEEDPELLTECVEEAIEHLTAAENVVLELEKQPTDLDLVNTLFRSFHTVKGIAGFLDLAPITGLAHAAEGLLDLCRNGKRTFNRTDSSTVLESLDELRRSLENFRTQLRDGSIPPYRVTVPESWRRLHHALLNPGPEESVAPSPRETDREETPLTAEPEPVFTPSEAPLAATEITIEEDGDLLLECVEESIEHLTAAENAVLELEQDPSDGELINTTFRSFHTVKGLAGFLGLTPVSQLAHTAESLLSRCRSGDHRFQPADSTKVLDAVDCLRRFMEDLRGMAQASSEGPYHVHVPARFATIDQALRAPATDSPTMTDRSESPDKALPTATTSPASTVHAPVAPTTDVAASIAKPPTHVPTVHVPMESAEPVATVSSAATPAPSKPAPASSGAQTPTSNGGTPPPSNASKASARDTFVRVRTDRLDQLLDAVGELVISQTMVAEHGTRDVLLTTKIAHAGKIVRELQDLSMSLRMVPLAATFQRMSRVVRDVAAKRGKSVQMVTHGDDTEIDRNLVDLLAEPLIHMIRNAVDHGVESPEERKLAGKNPKGTVTLSAGYEAGRIVIRLEDDGKGLKREAIVKKAIERELIDSADAMSDSEVFRLIFEPGFSTAETVTDVSGRGVGMDVVRRNVELLKGRIHVASEPGNGSTFSIHLPLTLAITDGMIVSVGSERYILPTLSIQMSFQPTFDQVERIPGRGELVMLRGRPVPLLRLHDIFDVDDARIDPTKGLLVVVSDADTFYALLVDELLGQQQVVTKALDTGSETIEGLGGGAILGDGRVGLILDIAALVKSASRLHSPLERRAAALLH